MDASYTSGWEIGGTGQTGDETDVWTLNALNNRIMNILINKGVIIKIGGNITAPNYPICLPISLYCFFIPFISFPFPGHMNIRPSLCHCSILPFYYLLSLPYNWVNLYLSSISLILFKMIASISINVTANCMVSSFW